jgi:hypothetical protein
MAGSDGRQAFAALAAAVAQRGTAAPGGFAGEKSVLPLAAHLLWLILAFHKLTSFRDKTGAREDNHEPGRVKARLKTTQPSTGINHGSDTTLALWRVLKSLAMPLV